MSLWDSMLSGLGYTRMKNGAHWYSRKGSAKFSKKHLMDMALGNAITYACIEIRAKMLSQAQFFYVQGDQKTQDHDVIKLINKPNALQSREDFLKQYEWYKCVYGFVYHKPYGPLGFPTEAIFNLNPAFIEFEKKQMSSIIWDEADINKYMAQKFKYKEPDQKQKQIEYGDVIPFFDTAMDLTKKGESSNGMKSPSRLISCLKSVCNSDMALDAENVMIQTNGRELFSGGATRGANLGAALPMNEDDKENIESNLVTDYGMTGPKKRSIATNQEILWQSLHIKLKDLGLHDSISNNANLIREVYEVPNELYKSFQKGSTYENQKEAMITFIQSTIQPIANDLATTWASFFDLEEGSIVASFDHLPVMQHAETKRAEKALRVAIAFQRLVDGAGLTTDQAYEFLQNQGIDVEREGN